MLNNLNEFATALFFLPICAGIVTFCLLIQAYKDQKE